MDISNWTVEDFVLDPGFKNWVMSPGYQTNIFWEGLLFENPGKLEEVKLAREILLNLSVRSFSLTAHDKEELWRKVELETEYIEEDGGAGRVIPLNAHGTISRMEKEKAKVFRFSQLYRVMAILVVCFGLGFLAAALLHKEETQTEIPVVYTEHITPPGVKSKLTLTDGTQVTLNSGSRLYYAENFQKNKRELFLEGEALFKVFKDLKRPFVVHTGTVSTTALGTSFSIHAYEDDAVNIYLLTGIVMVADQSDNRTEILLERGEAALADSKRGLAKGEFDEERATAWTRGIILFDRTPIMEAINVLENWYGVIFDLKNQPSANLTVSGKFDNELLENILLGLSYSARFQFVLRDDTVTLDFSNL